LDLNGQSLRVSWPKFPAGFLLETATALPALAWMTISEGIESSGASWTRTFDLDADPSSAYFRLRQRAFSITRDPQSLTLHAGDTAQFEVLTSGSNPLAYQWRLDDVDLVSANTANIVLNNVLPNQVGNYSVVVTDGVDSLASGPALLTVLTQPVITTHPVSQVVSANATVIFSVIAAGSGTLGYQWRRDGVNLPDETGSSLSIPNVQTTEQGAYDVVITDDYGVTTSNPATLTVEVRPYIVQQPQNWTAQVGEDVTFTVIIEGNPPPFSYRWRRSSVTLETQLLNSTTSRFTITNVQLANAGNYSVVVTNIATLIPGNSALSSFAVLTVNP
jgi:hypothetical protein